MLGEDSTPGLWAGKDLIEGPPSLGLGMATKYRASRYDLQFYSCSELRGSSSGFRAQGF